MYTPSDFSGWPNILIKNDSNCLIVSSLLPHTQEKIKNFMEIHEHKIDYQVKIKSTMNTLLAIWQIWRVAPGLRNKI